jgi:hypothetical protein
MAATTPLLLLLLLLGPAGGFKTGLEEGLICNVCVGTHPGKEKRKRLQRYSCARVAYIEIVLTYVIVPL